MSKFLELLRSGEELDCDLIIGDCDMPATFVWDEGSKITDYGIEKFKPIMEAECTRLENGNIEIHCDDENLGEQFCWAAAGYIGENEYNRIFGEEETTVTRTIEEAKKLIESLRPMQEDKTSDYTFPCPRCGHERMDKNPVRNALSRRADVYICNQCGTEEALMDMAGKVSLPLNEWAMVIGYDSEEEEEDPEEQKCRVCGCTWNNACEGGCYWAEEDLCSKCAEKMEAKS